MITGSARMRTLKEIDADAEQFPEPFRSVFIAASEFHEGLPVTQKCPDCQTPIRVRPLSGTAWRVECDCGRCNDTQRGI